MADKPPKVWEVYWGGGGYAEVQFAGSPKAAVRLDSAAWFAWLEAETTVSFAYPVYDVQAGYIAGWMTVRRERRARGTHYWVAYRRVAGRLRTSYLGGAAQLTRSRLSAVAAQFLDGRWGKLDAVEEVRAADAS